MSINAQISASHQIFLKDTLHTLKGTLFALYGIYVFFNNNLNWTWNNGGVVTLFEHEIKVLR